LDDREAPQPALPQPASPPTPLRVERGVNSGIPLKFKVHNSKFKVKKLINSKNQKYEKRKVENNS
jgi:hypothetical protein